MKPTATLLLCAACTVPPASTPPDGASAELSGLCVVQDGELRTIPVVIDSAGGDTLTPNGRPLSEVTGPYAAGMDWFDRKEMIYFRGIRHLQYGLPRAIPAAELAPAGDYEGLPLFTRPGDEQWAGFILIPVRHGCVFQPYEPPHRR